MGLIFNRGKGALSKGIDMLNEVAKIGKEAVTDKDKLNDLQYKIMETRATLLLSGKGSSVTKYVINALIAIIVCTGTYVFLVRPEGITMADFRDYAAAMMIVIGPLVGAFGGGSMFKHSKWSKDE
jgi:hypothetical protein